MAKTITFEGAPYTFPDDATDDEIAEALSSAAPAPADAPVPGAEATASEQAQPAPGAVAAPSTLDNVGSSIRGALGRGGSAVAQALGYGGGPAQPPETYQQSSDLDAMMRGQPAAPAVQGPQAAAPAAGGTRREGLAAGAFGLADQAARGVAKGAVSMLGIPGDLEAAGLNVIPGLSQLREAFGLSPTISRSVFGGAALRDALDTANDATIGAINKVRPADNQLDLPVREGANIGERLVGRIGEEIGGMALPAGAAVAKAAKVGMEGARAIQNPLARHFVEQAAANPAKFVQKEGIAGAIAGTGAGLANEATREMGYDDHSGVHAAGDLAGALGSLGVVGAARYGINKGRDIVGAITGSPGLVTDVSKEAAASRLAEAADAPSVRIGNREVPDTSSVVAAIKRGREGEQIADTVPGYRDTLADTIQNPGVARLEYGRRNGNSAPINRRADANEAAANKAVDSLAPEGNPGALRQGLADWRQTIQGGASAEAQAARTRFEDADSALRTVMQQDTRGEAIRDALSEAKDAAKQVERHAWEGLHDGEADIRPLADAFRDVRGGLSSTAQTLFDPTHLTGIPRGLIPAAEEGGEAAAGAAGRAAGEAAAGGAPAPMSAADRIMTAIEGAPKPERGGLGKAVWDVRSAAGLSEDEFRQGVAELVRDKRATTSQYSDPKSIRGKQGVDIGAGDTHLLIPAGENGLAGNPWPKGRPGAEAPRAPEPEAAPAAAGAGEANAEVPVSLRETADLRSALATEQREALSAQNPAKARVIGQYLDALDNYVENHHPDPEGYANARAVSRDMNDRFTRSTSAIGKVLREREGVPVVPDASVPERFVPPNSGDQRGFESLIREAGNDPRARDAVADQIRAKAEGLRRPEDVQRFVEEHSRVLDQFPGLRNQLETRGRTQQSATIAEDRRAGLEREYGTDNTRGSSAVGQYLHQGPENTSKAIQGVFNAAKPKEAARELLDFAGRSEEATAGMRRAIWDEAEKVSRRKGETTANAAGEQPWMTGKLKAFLTQPKVRAVVEEAYDPEHVQNIDKMLDVLQRANTGVRGKVANSSGTAQGVIENMKNAVSMESLQSTYGSFKRGQIGGSYAVTSILSKLARNVVRNAHQPAVNRMLDEALIDPKFAEALLRDNNPANRAYLRRTAKLQGISTGDYALGALGDDDDDPVKGALRRSKP